MVIPDCSPIPQSPPSSNTSRARPASGHYLDSSFPSQNTTMYSWPWEEKKDVCFPQGSWYMNVAKVGSFIWLTTDRARGR